MTIANTTNPTILQCQRAPASLGGFQYMLFIAAAAAVASVVTPERAASFNNLALIAEMVVMVIALLVGLVNTAVDGILLKERWHPVWVPVVAPLAVSLTFPLQDSGSAGQLLLEYLLRMTA